MSVQVAASDEALAAMLPEWESCWRRAPSASPFLAPAWLAPWWAVFGNGRAVVASLRGAHGLSAVLPLYRLGDALLPMGVGLSDYADALVAPGAPPDAAERLLAAALAATDAPGCDLPELPPGAHLLTAAAPPGWRAETLGGPPCPVLPLRPAPAVPKGMRRDMRQARNRAERRGAVAFERADSATLPGLLDALTRLHGARWQGRDEPGVLADPSVQAFHRAAARWLLAAGLLRLEALRIGGRIAAAVYALADSERILFYIGGFDPDFAFESPSTLLIGVMIDRAAADGLREAHFLRGGERYKYAWGAADRPNATRILRRL